MTCDQASGELAASTPLVTVSVAGEATPEPPLEAMSGAPSVTQTDHPIDELLARTEVAPTFAPAPLARPLGVASARLVGVQGASARVRFRGDLADSSVRIAPEVDRGLLELAARTGESVLVETSADGVAYVIGMLQTRPVGDLLLQASTITLAATKDITLVAGRAALRLRENGHVELVGTRISTISSGVLKLVGRLLRLN